MSYRWQLIKEQCPGCGICLDVCPEEAIFMPREKAQPEGVPGKCTGCLVCLKECPFEAIKILGSGEDQRPGVSRSQ